MNTKKPGYEATVALDAKVQILIIRYRDTRVPRDIVEAFDLLDPITSQEMTKVINRLFLSHDKRDDMLQDAFIKLKEVVEWGTWKPETNPTFVSFWRTVLRRHLLSANHSKTRPAALVDDVASKVPGVLADINARDVLTRLIAGMEREFKRYAKDRPLAEAVFRERILTTEPIEQLELATRFGVTQGFISRWEIWMRQKIKADFGHLWLPGDHNDAT